MTASSAPKPSAVPRSKGAIVSTAPSPTEVCACLRHRQSATPSNTRPETTRLLPRVDSSEGCIAASRTSMRKNITPHAASEPAAAAPARRGCWRAYRAKASVAAVEEASPPRIPVHRTPLCAPVIRIAKWPVSDRPAIRMTAHHSWYGLSAA